MLLFLLFLYAVYHTPGWKFNKVFLYTLGVFLFYFLYSLLIGSNIKKAIFMDLIINLKPFLGFFCAYHLSICLSNSRRKLLKEVSLLIWFFLLLPVGISSIFSDTLMDLIFFHPAYFGIATIVVSLCYLYGCDYTKRDKVIFLIIISLGILSGRSKIYGVVVLSFFLIFFFNAISNFKLNLKNLLLICGMLLVTFFVAWQKINLYFYQAIADSLEKKEDMIARFVLYKNFPDILKDYIPFGSGFASYATYYSGEYYSAIYKQYGLENIWGISRNYYAFISDTYYPSLAQFGVVGILLFILFWAYIIKNAVRYYKTCGNTLSKQMVLVLLIVGFIAIECTTGSAFVAQSGFFVMMILGMVLSDMKSVCIENINPQNL
jgi:hypothetical protein